MPDRQRHSRLSDAFARLLAARKPPAPAGRRRAGGPARPQGTGTHPREQVSRDGGSADRTKAPEPGEPFWARDPWADTMELSRSGWELSDPLSRQPDHPDPMADTMQLSRAAVLRQSAKPAEPDAAPAIALDTADIGTGINVDLNADLNADAEPVRSQSVRSLLLEKRRRLAVCAAGLAALGALLALPPVRAQLRDSFTKLPQPYTALYFTSPPQVDGTILTVPVSVHAVDTGTDAYTVRVWTVDAKGRVDNSKNAGLTWDGQAMSAVVSMPVNPAADTVWVSLGGSTETLHYKIAVA